MGIGGLERNGREPLHALRHRGLGGFYREWSPRVSHSLRKRAAEGTEPQSKQLFGNQGGENPPERAGTAAINNTADDAPVPQMKIPDGAGVGEG